jgi:hypothetical protein
MEKLLKKGHAGIIAQLNALQLCETQVLDPPLEMKQVLDTYSLVFDIPTSLPPSNEEHDHNIPLIPSSQSPSVHPYHYLFAQKNEIEKIIQELLATGVTFPSAFILHQWQWF